ncbi:MAG: universal stress protein [Pseudomonadota bacterium]
MSTYKRILALVAMNGDSAFVAKRAVQLSRSYGATLALAAVVDYTPGFESDHVPFLTPGEMRLAIVRDMREKLDQMITEVGADGCEIIVGCGSEKQVVSELTGSWRPDLVLVGSLARHGLAQNGERATYDVLTIQSSRPSVAGRMINALAAAL